MKTLFAFLALLFVVCIAYSEDENPGHLDNPTAIALVQAQLRDNNQDPQFFDITYVSSQMFDDQNGATQTYSVVNKKTGHAFKVIIAIHWEEDTTKLHTFTMPTHPPQV